MEAVVESFRLLSDEQLLAEVRLLVVRERTATTVLIASLAEVSARRLYLAQGYSSLYKFCADGLQMSDGAAYRRMRAAKAVQRFPVALNKLVDGSLTLTSLTVLAPHLTIGNHMALLTGAEHKTRVEVERQVAALYPDAPDLVTLKLRVRRQTHDKLQRARALLRHAVPSGDLDDTLDRALTLLIAELEKKKLGKVTRPRRAQKVAPGSRYITAEVRRVVTERDGGRCAFVGTDGRCRETTLLEFHHVVAFAKGGARTADNIQLRCSAHNRYEGEQEFGPLASQVRERQPLYGEDGGRPAGEWTALREIRAPRPPLPAARGCRRGRTAGPQAGAS